MDFKEQVKRSFASCKQDITNLKEDNEKLQEEVSQLKQQNQQLNSTLESLNNTIYQLQNQINAMQQNQTIPNTQTITPDIAQKKPTTKQEKSAAEEDPYEALLAFKAKANKREVLKQKITSMISENGMLLSELRFMFVDHFRYCSKATFYNYLKELEYERVVKIERHNSKNVIFLEGMKKEI